MKLQEALDLARQGLDAIDQTRHGWTVDLLETTEVTARTDYNSRTLFLSRPLTELRTFDELVNSVKHELAHILTVGHQHDKVWFDTFVAIGGNGRVRSE